MGNIIKLEKRDIIMAILVLNTSLHVPGSPLIIELIKIIVPTTLSLIGLNEWNRRKGK